MASGSIPVPILRMVATGTTGGSGGTYTPSQTIELIFVVNGSHCMFGAVVKYFDGTRKMVSMSTGGAGISFDGTTVSLPIYSNYWAFAIVAPAGPAGTWP